MKKIIALLLALVMVFSLAACNDQKPVDTQSKEPQGSNNTVDTQLEETEPTDVNLFEEHVTLTYCVPDSKGVTEYEGWQAIMDAVNAITEEKINATIKFEVISLGEYTSKMNAKYIGGEEFDVCFTGAWNPYATAVADGGYAELTQEMLATYAADTLAVLNEDCWDAVTIEGKIYGVPLQQIWVRQNSIRFNADTADKYDFDYTSVKDLKDLTPYLKTLKDAGEQYIFWTHVYDNMTSYLGYDFVSGSSFTPGAVYFADEKPVVFNQFATEEFLELCKLMREWQEAGYIHPDQQTGELDKNLFAVNLNPAYKPGGDATESASRGYSVVSVPVGSAALTTSGIVATNLAVGATSKNPERALAFINLLNTDAELLNLICHGIEGTDWKFVDEANKVIEMTSGYKGFHSFLIGNVFNEYYVDASQVGSWEETAEINGNAPGSPILGFGFNAEPVSTEIANCKAIVTEYIEALDAGEYEDVEGTIAEMNKKLEDAGLQTILDEMQSQIDAWYNG